MFQSRGFECTKSAFVLQSGLPWVLTAGKRDRMALLRASVRPNFGTGSLIACAQFPEHGTIIY